ncbi:hypothetical protein Q5762_07445 [Streptomyces sp. P9(2023)]|uniref:hypothetical protein n=1 Tax=Streptomyces sp. P9(2023) TaxID=3064394 RepID=UPI0028F3FF72|nr:hypothetical protein [Streptomyces sp. P9(2023)]MDT9688191.1 hypothetical protein [Streptomyces sp. P9(2023)]
MAIYQRTNGGHVAESLRPMPDSEEAVELENLAANPASGWRRVDEEPPAPAGPPAKSASKGDWVAYAVAQGADEAEAEKTTKDELISAYGGEG